MAAVRAVAARLRVGPIEPVVVALAKHTTVRLAPLPLVARVQSAVSPSQAGGSLASELSIARYLAFRQAPTVRPATGIDPGPHLEGRCAMTLWEFVPHRAAETEADMQLAARALRRFHRAFESYGGALPLFTAAIDACEDTLAVPSRTPALEAGSRTFLSRLHIRLRGELSSHTYEHTPLHGDAHLGNVMLTDAGAVWADLEATCRGPREWDIVSLPEATWSEFNEVDADLIRCLADLRSLCVAVWCWADYGRSSAVNEAAEYHLQSLKARFAPLCCRVSAAIRQHGADA
jgi:hypothetical protein